MRYCTWYNVYSIVIELHVSYLSKNKTHEQTLREIFTPAHE